MQSDATNWTTDDPTNITLAHQSTAVADSEVNWEKSHKCLKITVSGDQSGDNVYLPVANWGDSSPTLSTIPWAGCWIRADASGNVCDLIYNTDGTDVTETVTIASANRWQFVEFDLSSATGNEVDFRVNIKATSSVDIWISRTWYVQDSREITGNIATLGTLTDERITVAANSLIASGSGATDLGRCLIHFQGAYNFALGYINLQTTFSSCLVDGDSNVSYITKNTNGSGLIFDQDGSVNLLSGTENNEFVNSAYVVLPKYFHSNDDYNYIFVYGAATGISPHLLSGYNKWDVFKNPRCYGCTTGIGPTSSGNYNLYTFNDMKLVSCGEGIDTTLATSVFIEGITFVNNTTKALVDGGSSLLLFDDSVDETTGFTFNQQTDGMGLFIYRSVNFVTDPVTSSASVRAISTLTNTMGYLQTGFHTTGGTDGSGEITELWCLYKNRWTASNQTIFSDASNKWNFQFMKGGVVIADVDYDIVSGVGTVASPTTVSVTAVPSISNQQLDDYAITTAEQTTASCDVTNMTANDEVFIDINNGQFVYRLDTSDNAAYSTTFNGHEIGVGTNMEVTFYAVNTSGKDEQAAGSNLTVTRGSYATRIHDVVITIRDLMRNNLTDPKTATRTASNWIFTSYPELTTKIEYPIICVTHSGDTAAGLGMQSEGELSTVELELDIFSKSTKERDEVTDDVIDLLRTQKLELKDSGLYNYKRTNAFDNQAQQSEGIARKTLTIQYDLVTG